MKKSLITEITIWLLTSLVIAFTVIYGINQGFGFEVFSKEKALENLDYSREYIQDTDNIGSLKVYWVAGDVIIKKGDSKKIKITEYSASEITEENELSLSVSGIMLNVSWNDTRLIYVDTVVPEPNRKNLVIEVPKEMSIDKITVNGVQSSVTIDSLTTDESIAIKTSSDIRIDGCKSKSISLNTQYGEISCTGISANTLDISGENSGVDLTDAIAYNTNIKNITGDVTFTGEFNNLSFISNKGSITALTKVQTENIRISTASGTVELTTPSDATANVSYSTMTGSFVTDYSDLPKSGKSGQFSIGEEQNGNIVRAFSLTTTSGSITLNKGDTAGKNSLSFT